MHMRRRIHAYEEEDTCADLPDFAYEYEDMRRRRIHA